MPKGDAVSFSQLEPGKYKIRWRERRTDGPGWKNRGLTVEGGEIARDALMVEIRKSLAETGRYNPDDSEVLPPPPPADFDVILGTMIDRRFEAGKYALATKVSYDQHRRRFLERVREVEGLAVNGPVPVTLLRRDLFERINAVDRAREVSATAAYGSIRLAIEAWRYAHDANNEATAAGRPLPWFGLPPPPSATTDYRPRAPRYGRTVAPELEHVDAVLRRLRHKPRIDMASKMAVIFMRYTGLRAMQVLVANRDHLDIERRTLFVSVYKTEQEEADARTVPVARQLFSEPGLMEYLRSIPAGRPLFGKATDPASTRTKNMAPLLHDLWADATTAKEVPKHVWWPQNRRIGRPEHAFRAAFDAHLISAGVPSEVVDFLVGRLSGSIRDTHYGRELLEAAAVAVDGIPAVDWTDPNEASNVVLLDAFRRR